MLDLQEVSVVIDGRRILDHINWAVGTGERWVVLGPNGCGKSTLMEVASLRRHPTGGRLRVLGGELGTIDVRSMRARIGISGASLADQLRPALRVIDAVITAKHAALEAWWHDYDDSDHERAVRLLAQVGCDGLEDRAFGTLSSGERQRVLLARTLMPSPELLILDEPAAGMDLSGREQLASTLARLAVDPETPPTVLVTHHVDEIPPGFTHALLMRRGDIMAAGDLHHTITSDSVSHLFDLRVDVTHDDGRWTARSTD